jgi:peptidyl-prolyl cis-trans isomerase D
MLDTLRANSRSVVTYLLFGIIIVVFVVSFGPGSKGCTSGGRSETWAARVNGTTVTPGEFLAQYRALGGGRGSDDAFVRQEAMALAVRMALIEQEAERHGVSVSDEELAGAITRMREFQDGEGHFDPERYRRIVNSAYGSQKRYEDEKRRELAVRRMVELVASTVKVSEAEAKESWAAERDRAALQFAVFSVDRARQEIARPGDAEVAAFAEKNGPRIEQFYKDTPARFNRSKRVKARHILVKVAESAPGEEGGAAGREEADRRPRRAPEEGRGLRSPRRRGLGRPRRQGQGGRAGLLRPGAHGQAVRGRRLRAR